MADQASFTMVCNGCVEIAVAVAAGSPTVTVVDTNGTLGTVTAGNSQTFNDYLVNGNTATVSIPDGNTVASGKITGTIKYTNCPTPTPPPPTATAGPSPTPSPTPTAVPPTPSPTPATNTITGGSTCDTATNWPAYGSANKYEITLVSNVEQCFNVTSAPSRTIYMSATGSPTTPISGTVTLGQDSGSFSPLCFYDSLDPQAASSWLTGNTLNASNVGTFSLVLPGGTGTFDIWIV